MKPWEVSDELWAVIEPLLPQRQRRFRHPGRKRLDDRLALQGILFVLHTGIAWEHLSQELGYGSGMTCWRRLAEWNKAGVWQRLHEVLLDQLRAADALDLCRAGSKHHLITEATGIPLAVILTGANRNDVTQLCPLLDAIPKVRGKRGRPRRRPDVVLADRGYDHDKYRALARELQIRPLIARRGTEHGSGVRKQRWVVEQTFALLHAFRRLRIRWEIQNLPFVLAQAVRKLKITDDGGRVDADAASGR
ncbi:transposase [Nonomuraea wenchangensis]